MESIRSSCLISPKQQSKSFKAFSKSIDLIPVSGTLFKLPSGKTAIAHGSGVEKIKHDIEREIRCKKPQSAKSLTVSLKKPTRVRKPAKYLTYTLEEILEMYEKSI